MIHNGGGFFGSYPKPDTLDTWSKAILYCGSEKSEFYYIEQLFDNTAHFYAHFWTWGMD